jgi:hypothetical protein
LERCRCTCSQYYYLKIVGQITFNLSCLLSLPVPSYLQLYNLEAATFLFIFFFFFSATNIASALFLKLNNVNTKSEAANNATDLGKDPFGCTRMQYVTSHVELFTSCICSMPWSQAITASAWCSLGRSMDDPAYNLPFPGPVYGISLYTYTNSRGLIIGLGVDRNRNTLTG